MIAVLRLSAKTGGEGDTLAAAHSSIAQLERLDTLDDLLREHLPVERVFNRTSLLMAHWFASITTS